MSRKPKKAITAKQAFEAAAACVPTSWLDPLLTGPRRVIGDKGDSRDIESLLLAVKKRIQAAAAEVL